MDLHYRPCSCWGIPRFRKPQSIHWLIIILEKNPLVMTNSLLLTIAIEIVDLPIKDGDFPQLCKRLPEGNGPKVG